MALIDEAYGPYTAYLQRMGLGGGGYWNPAQRYQAAMYDPIRSLYEMQQPIGMAAGQTMPAWENYMPGAAQGMGGVRSQAANVMQQLLGLTPGRRQEMGLNYEPTYDPLTGRASYEGGSMSDLQNLMQMGLANRFGGIGANWAASRLPQMQQQWQSQLAGGGQGTTFLDYIRQKYGI